MTTWNPAKLVDIARESPETLALYGAVPGEASFANNCLLARRLAERGVRFIQLYHRDWDHHLDLPKLLPERAKQTDQATAGTLKRGHRAVPWEFD